MRIETENEEMKIQSWIDSQMGAVIRNSSIYLDLFSVWHCNNPVAKLR